MDRMNAKSDDFDEVVSMGFRGPWAKRGDEEHERWPSEEHERTTVRAFPIEADDVERDDEAWDGEEGDDGRGDPQSNGVPRRAPRSSSPELPTGAMLALMPLTAHPRRAAFDPLAPGRGGAGHDDEPEIEIQVETYRGGEPDEDADDRGAGDDYDAVVQACDADDDDDHADAHVGAQARDASGYGVEVTEEDASWWMSIDAGLLAEGSIDLDEEELPPLPGVVTGSTGGEATLDQRILDAIAAPLELQCSCGCEPDEREQLLRSLFRQLSANESNTLRYRLTLARANDQVARSFVALPASHRTRLLDFLDHHARRQAFEGPNWRVIRKG
jgi:hypothetical protein